MPIGEKHDLVFAVPASARQIGLTDHGVDQDSGITDSPWTADLAVLRGSRMGTALFGTEQAVSDDMIRTAIREAHPWA